jgi:hypothetical protein
MTSQFNDVTVFTTHLRLFSALLGDHVELGDPAITFLRTVKLQNRLSFRGPCLNIIFGDFDQFEEKTLAIF